MNAEGKSRNPLLPNAGIASLAVGFFSWYVCSNWMSTLFYEPSETYWRANRSAGALIALPIAYCLLRSPAIVQKRGRLLDWVFACSQAGSILLLSTLTENNPSPTLLALCTFSFGLGMLWSIGRWSERYAASGTRTVVFSLIIACIFLAVEKTVAAFLPPAASATVIAALPFLAAGILVTRRKDTDRPHRGDPVYSRETIPSLWRIAIAITLFFLIWTIFNAILKELTGHISFGEHSAPALAASSQLLLVAFGLFSYWWAVAKGFRLDVTVIWRVAFVLLGLSLALLLSFGLVQPLQTITGLAVVIGKLFLWLMLINIARRGTMRPFSTVFFGMLLFWIPDFLGRSLVYTHLLANDIQLLASTSLAAIVIVLAFFLPDRSPDAESLLDDLDEQVPKNARLHAKRSADQACDALAAQYDISPREADVLRLLCVGRSRPYIAETLFLSENTVRSHTRNIYQKMQVHSRQELLDLVNEKMS